MAWFERMRIKMKKLTCLIGLMIFVNAMANCPDFSGEYLQDSTSCKGDLKKRSPWPLVSQPEASTVTINQHGCKEIKLNYHDTRFSNRPTTEVTLDLKDAQSITIDESKMIISFVFPKSTVNYFGHTMSSKEVLKLKFIKSSENHLEITTLSKSSGFFNYVIPFVEKAKSTCRLIKI